MGILDGTQRLGNSVSKTTSEQLVVCPECGTKATYAVVHYGINCCHDCDTYFGEDVPQEEVNIETLTCQSCSEDTHKIPKNRSKAGTFDKYICSNEQCSRILEIESGTGKFIPVLDFLSGSHMQTSFDESTPAPIEVSEVDGVEKESVVELLNTEAEAENSTFRLYNPDSSEALLAYQDNAFVGYLTWGTEEAEEVGTLPVFRQVFVLPSYRRQGVATSLIQYFINHVVPVYTDGLYAVEGANISTLRVLESMDEVAFTVDFEEECITDVDRGNVVFYKSNPFQQLASKMARR